MSIHNYMVTSLKSKRLRTRNRLIVLTSVNRKAFENALVPGLDSQYMHLKSCVWHAPKGFSSQPVLQPIYGRGLYRLFREILKVPNLTNGEAWVYLRQLRDDQSTTMADVAEIYVYLQDNYANR